MKGEKNHKDSARGTLTVTPWYAAWKSATEAAPWFSPFPAETTFQIMWSTDFQQTRSCGTKMSQQRLKPGVREAPVPTGPVNKTRYGPDQILSQPTPRKRPHVIERACVCVLYARTCWNCIRSNATWNYWHVGWGLEILWQKDFKCHGICFHRIWLFFWGKHHSKAKTV